MNSELLKQMGLEMMDPGYLFLGIAAVNVVIIILVIVLFIKFSKLKKKYQHFMSGKNAANLEKDIIRLYEDNIEMKENIQRNKGDIREIFGTLEKTFQKIGIVKYDAFQQMGGKLSFSMALLNQEDNGFILNSVHSTEGCYCYTKEIKEGKCSIDLGEEEKEALKIAMNEEGVY